MKATKVGKIMQSFPSIDVERKLKLQKKNYFHCFNDFSHGQFRMANFTRFNLFDHKISRNMSRM